MSVTYAKRDLGTWDRTRLKLNRHPDSKYFCDKLDNLFLWIPKLSNVSQMSSATICR